MDWLTRLKKTDQFFILSRGFLIAGLIAVGAAAFIFGGSYAIDNTMPLANSQAGKLIFLNLITAVILLILSLTSFAYYRMRLTESRLRGLANYVEKLRCFTVTKFDAIEHSQQQGACRDENEAPPAEVPTEPQTEKPLGTRERDTLLTIIAALAKEAKLQIDKPGKIALYIEGLTAELGAPVSKRAIEDHLKKIPNALETRMK